MYYILNSYNKIREKKMLLRKTIRKRKYIYNTVQIEKNLHTSEPSHLNHVIQESTIIIFIFYVTITNRHKLSALTQENR